MVSLCNVFENITPKFALAGTPSASIIGSMGNSSKAYQAYAMLIAFA